MATPTVPAQRRRVMAAKAETTYGTDEFGGTVTAADLMPVADISVNPTRQQVDIITQGGELGRSAPAIFGFGSVEITCRAPLRGKGSAYAVEGDIEVNDLLKACGMQVAVDTTTGSEKITYTPLDSGHDSLTIYIIQENGPTIKAVGCLGNVNFVFPAGGAAVAEFNFLGQLLALADVAFVSTQFSTTPQYPVVKGANFTYAGDSTLRVANFNLDMGNAREQIESMNAAQAIAGSFIPLRNPSGSFDPEQVTVASLDFDTKWRDATLEASSLQAGATQYNQVKLNTPKGQLTSLGQATRGEKMIFQVGYLALINTGEDDFTLTFD